MACSCCSIVFACERPALVLPRMQEAAQSCNLCLFHTQQQMEDWGASCAFGARHVKAQTLRILSTPPLTRKLEDLREKASALTAPEWPSPIARQAPEGVQSRILLSLAPDASTVLPPARESWLAYHSKRKRSGIGLYRRGSEHAYQASIKADN